MYLRDWRVHIDVNWAMEGVRLQFFHRLPNGQLEVISGIGVSSISPEHVTTYPQGDVFEVPSLLAQELMDKLWQAGLRPSEGTGSAGALAAAEANLKDLRGINQGLMEMLKETSKSRERYISKLENALDGQGE